MRVCLCLCLGQCLPPHPDRTSRTGRWHGSVRRSLSASGPLSSSVPLPVPLSVSLSVSLSVPAGSAGPQVRRARCQVAGTCGMGGWQGFVTSGAMHVSRLTSHVARRTSHVARRTSHAAWPMQRGPCSVDHAAWCTVHVGGESCMVHDAWCMVDGALSDLEGSASTCAADGKVGLRRVSGYRWPYPLLCPGSGLRAQGSCPRSQVSGLRSQAQGTETAGPSREPLLTRPGAQPRSYPTPQLPNSPTPQPPSIRSARWRLPGRHPHLTPPHRSVCHPMPGVQALDRA